MILSSDEKVRGWGCSKCKGEDFEEGDKLRVLRNCDTEENQNIAWEWMPSLRRCPWSQIDAEAWACISWWSEYRELGALPWGGGDLMDQPNFVIEAIIFCTELKNSIELEKAERRAQAWHKQSAKSQSR